MKLQHRLNFLQSILSAILLLLGFSAKASDNLWTETGNYDISWYSERNDTYYIDSPSQLAGIAYLVNEQSVSFSNSTIILRHDIDLSGHLWVPIGNGGINQEVTTQEGTYGISAFTGFFDGDGHKITGMNIDCNYITPDEDKIYYIGLFGRIGHPLSFFTDPGVSNLYMENCSIKMEGSTEDWQTCYIGTIAGITSRAKLNNINVNSNIMFTPPTLFTQVWLGGICGEGDLDNCVFSGNIEIKTDRNSYLGGIVGNGYAVNCVNNGNITFYGVFGNVAGICARGNADGCTNNGNIRVDGYGNYDLGYGFSVEVGGVCSYYESLALNSSNRGNIESRLYSSFNGSNMSIIYGISPVAINSYNWGNLISETHNAAIDWIECIPNNEPYSSEKTFYNSYSFNDSCSQYVGEEVVNNDDAYMKSDEMLALLNDGAINISKGNKYIAQNWVRDNSGRPMLSGKNLYRVELVGGNPSGWGTTSGFESLEIYEEWTQIYLGEATVNGICFNADDEVKVTVTPSDDYELEEVYLDPDMSDDALSRITFDKSDVKDGVLTFRMPPYHCHIKFKFNKKSIVKNIKEDNAGNIIIYTIDGKEIQTDNIEGLKLPSGIYLIKSNNEFKKIFIK